MNADVCAIRDAQKKAFAPISIESQRSDFNILLLPIDAISGSGAWSGYVEAKAASSKQGLLVRMVEELDVIKFFGGTRYGGKRTVNLQ